VKVVIICGDYGALIQVLPAGERPLVPDVAGVD
jgi:hypothetical protein